MTGWILKVSALSIWSVASLPLKIAYNQRNLMSIRMDQLLYFFVISL